MKRIESRIVVLAVLAIAAACGGRTDGVAVGSRAPSFELRGLDGRLVSSRSLHGRAVVLNFWATWCQPCRKEIPVLAELAAESEVDVLAIALDEDGASSVRPFVERHRIDYPVLLGDQRLFERFDGFGIPYTLVLDASFTIVGIYRGPVSLAALEEDLARMGEEA